MFDLKFFKKMGSLSRLQKLSGIGLGISGGLAVYFYTKNKDQTVLNSWTTNTIVSPAAKWDPNWDQYVLSTQNLYLVHKLQIGLFFSHQKFLLYLCYN